MRLALLASLLMLYAGSASARPLDREVPGCREDAIFVLDASGSMAGGVGGNNLGRPRIDVVRQAMAETLPAITANRKVGLIVYGPGPYNICSNIDLKLKPRPAAAQAIIEIVTDVIPAGRTPMTRAVELAAEELKHREKPAIVVLLTDGEETCGGDPCATAARLKAEGLNLVVHVIGYQMREAAGTLGTVQSRCMAQATGGQYAHADSVEDIKRALSSMLGCPDVSRAPDHAAR
jgi:Ca-activated chloride channel family protein